MAIQDRGIPATDPHTALKNLIESNMQSRWDVESGCESKLADWEETKDIPNCDSTHLW